MRVRPVWLGLNALLACLAGCTSWARLPETRPVPARGTVQVWSSGHAALLRDPQVVRDSLVGRAPLPDTSQSAVPLAGVDSVRIQTADPGKTLIVGTGVAMALLLAYLQGLRGLE